jgi:hypothetical protein
VLRVTVVAAPDLTVIRVDGRLARTGLGELERECRMARRPVVLDLTQLTGLDDGGCRLLKQLSAEGYHLLGVAPYFALLLQDRTPDAQPGGPAPCAHRTARGRSASSRVGRAPGLTGKPRRRPGQP